MAGIGTWALDDALKVVQADGRETALGTLKRVDRDGTAWVTLGEGAGEFPADLGTATANPGDSVTVRIRDGRASITGNATDRSASSSETRQAHSVASQAFDGALRASSAANAAEQLAQGAKDSADSAAQAAERAWDHADDAATAAQNAWDHADSAATAAGNAWDRAGDALTAAQSAQASANTANTYSNAALDQLGVVQDVAGILTWASEHGSFTQTSDQSIVDGKVYFTYDSTTHDYTPVVDPQASALSTYYELTVDEAMNDFIMAHLAVTTRGLWVLPAGLPSTDQTVDNTVDKASSSDTSAQKQANANARKADDYKVLLSNDGLYVYDGDGVLVSTFGESITFSSLRQQYIGNEDAYILFTPASGNDDASITIGGANVTLGSSKKLSELLEEVDAKAARGTGILHVTTAPSSYTTTQGGFTPSYRISLSTAKSQAGVAEVIVGDIVEHDSWHYPVGYVSSSYVYMGERVSIKGAQGETGGTGSQGVAGLNQATVYLYKRADSASKPTSGTSTYTFSTGVLTGVPSGWSQTFPAETQGSTTPVWMMCAVASANTATDDIGYSEWTTPIKMVSSGSNGHNHAVVTLYQRAASTPSKPSGTVTYTFSTGTLSPVPSGWSTGVPSGSNPCYVTQAACVSQSDTYSIASSAWTDPSKLVEDGAKGDTGPEAVVDVTFDSVDWAAGSATLRASLLVNGSAPSGTVTYQWRKNGSNVSGKTSQTVSIGSGTGDMTAVWSCAVTWDGYTQAGSIDLAPLAQAAAVAGNYIVETASNDVWIHSEGHGPDTDPNSQTYGEATQDTYGWRIGSVFELIRAGASYLKMWVDSNLVAHVRVGLESAGHSVFSPDGMEVFTDASTSVAKFGSTGAQIGKSDELQLKMTSSSMALENDTDDSVFSVTENSSGAVQKNAILATYSDSSYVTTASYSVSDSLAASGGVTVTLETGGDVYTLASSNYSCTVTAGTGLTLSLTSGGVTQVSAFLDESGESGVLSIDYHADHYDAARLEMTGVMELDGEGDVVTLTNTGWSSTNKTDTLLRAENPSTGNAIEFGVGSGGNNRGVYDPGMKRWLIYSNGSNIYLNGGKVAVTDNGLKRNGALAMVVKNGDTSQRTITNWQFALTDYGNIRLDKSTNNGSTWTTVDYFMKASASLAYQNVSNSNATSVTIAGNSGGSVDVNLTTPTGYMFAGIYRITTNHNNALHITGFWLGSGVLTVYLYNISSQSMATTVTASARYISSTPS